MFILGTLTSHTADQTIHRGLFDFVTELFCTKQKKVSLVENSFARSCISIFSSLITKSPTKCVCAMHYHKTCKLVWNRRETRTSFKVFRSSSGEIQVYIYIYFFIVAWIKKFCMTCSSNVLFWFALFTKLYVIWVHENSNTPSKPRNSNSAMWKFIFSVVETNIIIFLAATSIVRKSAIPSLCSVDFTQSRMYPDNCVLRCPNFGSKAQTQLLRL